MFCRDCAAFLAQRATAATAAAAPRPKAPSGPELDDIYQAERMTVVIDSSIGLRYDVVPWYVLHKNLFTWIAIEKKILFLGFILIVIVAAFSIISTLVMLTMEKRSEIGILKTIGSTPGAWGRITRHPASTICCPVAI